MWLPSQSNQGQHFAGGFIGGWVSPPCLFMTQFCVLNNMSNVMNVQGFNLFVCMMVKLLSPRCLLQDWSILVDKQHTALYALFTAFYALVFSSEFIEGCSPERALLHWWQGLFLLSYYWCPVNICIMLQSKQHVYLHWPWDTSKLSLNTAG